jgi:hypothetical protein
MFGFAPMHRFHLRAVPESKRSVVFDTPIGQPVCLQAIRLRCTHPGLTPSPKRLLSLLKLPSGSWAPE